MRACRLILVAVASLPLAATTLERLSLEEMAQKSTAVVRARVTACSGAVSSGAVFTRCDLAPVEVWKGRPGARPAAWIPGGSAGRLAQTVNGAPQLTPGREYVFFLWNDRAGRSHPVGLSQGVFLLQADERDGTVAVRDRTQARMVDGTGREVPDAPVRYPAAELKRLVRTAVARAPEASR